MISICVEASCGLLFLSLFLSFFSFFSTRHFCFSLQCVQTMSPIKCILRTFCLIFRTLVLCLPPLFVHCCANNCLREDMYIRFMTTHVLVHPIIVCIPFESVIGNQPCIIMCDFQVNILSQNVLKQHTFVKKTIERTN